MFKEYRFEGGPNYEPAQGAHMSWSRTGIIEQMTPDR
jgi:hypothetical protein